MTSQYAVLGQPVSHSKSPDIHTHFARQTGEDVNYGSAEVSPEQFPDMVAGFFDGGGKGLNITLPHKEAAFRLCKQLSERAQLAAAVNTLYMKDGELCGENTDGPGLVRDIRDNHGVELRDKSILILGAGGAARGVIPALLDEHPASITLLNRTLSKAEAIRNAMLPATIKVSDYAHADQSRHYDLIINATSLSLEGKLPPVSNNWITEQTCCYDMMYADSATVFQQWAREHGAHLALDGLGMLVEQAAESFYIWRGVRPETADVIQALRAA